MSLLQDLTKDVKKIFGDQWTVTEKITIPNPEDLKFGNDAGHFVEATVLYADLDGSTHMVDNEPWQTSAEVYKTYLMCAAKLIKNLGGVITAYDGDRVMAIFLGASKNSNAAKCALNLNYAVNKIINPAFKLQYPKSSLVIRQVVGIDTSELRVARVGVKNDNDLVWVGKAANYAAKLTNKNQYSTYITKEVYSRLNAESKYDKNGVEMWTRTFWSEMNNLEIYVSNYYRGF